MIQFLFYYKQYNLSIKQQIMKLTLKQPFTSQSSSNKQNLKRNLNNNNKQQGSYRHRNDHSIQTKSPIKIPINANSSAKKQDLTFRNKTEQYAGCYDQWEQSEQFGQICGKNKFILYTQPAVCEPGFSASMKININQILSKKSNTDNEQHLQQQDGVAQLECGLIDDLWQICNRLSLIKNQCIKQSISIVQVQVRKMLAIIAKQNYTDEAPLASSKKIKLQNCIAQSHCEKQADQKQIQSDQQLQSNNYESSNSRRTIFLERLGNFDMPSQLRSSTPKECVPSQQLQTKKIMYMLDGRQPKPEITPTTNNNNKRKISQESNGNGVASQRISSLSSFNQNSCDDSGFTVFEIQKLTGSERRSRCSNNNQQTNQQTIESDKKVKNCKQPEQQMRIFKKQNKIESQGLQSGEGSLMSVGSKRKILNDIVAMLNHKYNKNIRLK